jgi:formamidopyrimidine-DNA glycosylase
MFGRKKKETTEKVAAIASKVTAKKVAPKKVAVKKAVKKKAVKKKAAEKPAEIADIKRGDPCPQCEHKRFKTVSKAAGTFGCRKCGQVLKNAA